MIRWLKFSAVGILGIGVQLVVLAILLKLKVHYLLATALAVEAALLHNYVLHKYWTWAGREKRPGRLLRFHLANGLISLLSNLVWMRVLAGSLHLPAIAANIVAIAATAVLNFVLADRWVFSKKIQMGDPAGRSDPARAGAPGLPFTEEL